MDLQVSKAVQYSAPRHVLSLEQAISSPEIFQ